MKLPIDISTKAAAAITEAAVRQEESSVGGIVYGGLSLGISIVCGITVFFCVRQRMARRRATLTQDASPTPVVTPYNVYHPQPPPHPQPPQPTPGYEYPQPPPPAYPYQYQSPAPGEYAHQQQPPQPQPQGVYSFDQHQQQQQPNPNANVTQQPQLSHSTEQRASQLIDALTTMTHTKTHDKLTCPICLGPLAEDELKAGNCLHVIHKECLESWLVKDSALSCPVCRRPYATDFGQLDPNPEQAQGGAGIRA